MSWIATSICPKTALAKDNPANRAAVFQALESPVVPPVIERQNEMQDAINEALSAVAIGELVPEEPNPGVENILSLVNDDRTVQEIGLQTHSSEFHVCRILYDQLRKGRFPGARGADQGDALAVGDAQ